MNNIFLGKPWHWVLLGVASVIFWLSGSNRFHVIEFNLFVSVLLIATAIALFVMIRFHRPGDRITREELLADENLLDKGDAESQVP